MYPTGDKYQSDRSSSRCPLRDLNKYTSDTSISMCLTGDKYTYMYKLSTVYKESEKVCVLREIHIRISLL